MNKSTKTNCIQSCNNSTADTAKLVYPLYLQELADSETEIPEEVATVRSKRDGDDSEEEHKDFTATLLAVSAQALSTYRLKNSSPLKNSF